MAVGASQGAAGAVAAGSAAGAAVGAAAAGGIIGTVTGTIAGASVGGQAGVVVAAAVAVATGVTVRLEQNVVLQICPDNSNYNVYPGRLDIYFQTTDRFTLEEEEQLEELVIGRYNDFFGCDSVYNRVMLNTTMLRCVEAKEECCKIVDTDFGPSSKPFRTASTAGETSHYSGLTGRTYLASIPAGRVSCKKSPRLHPFSNLFRIESSVG